MSSFEDKEFTAPISKEDLEATIRVINYVNSAEYESLSYHIQRKVNAQLKELDFKIQRDRISGVRTAVEYRLFDGESMTYISETGIDFGGTQLPFEVARGNIDSYVAQRVKHHVDREAARDSATYERDMKLLEELAEKYPHRFVVLDSIRELGKNE